MADSFPDTPQGGSENTWGWTNRAPNFFPDTPPDAHPGAAHGAADSAEGSGSTESPTTPRGKSKVQPWRDVERKEAPELRSGRLDTLGWVSASWEPRCVVLRVDGTLSVKPFGRGRKLAHYSASSSASTQQQQLWSPLVSKLKGRGGGAAFGVTGRSTSMSSGMGSGGGGAGASGGSMNGGRLGSLHRGMVGKSGYPRIAAVDQSLSDLEVPTDVDTPSVASSIGGESIGAGGSDAGDSWTTEKRGGSRRARIAFSRKQRGGLRRPRSSEWAGASVGFDDDDDDECDDEDGLEEDDVEDIELSKWDLSRPGKRDKEGRALALSWTRRFHNKIATEAYPSLRSFASLPDRDWNREWEEALSLAGGGRGGRDPRVTISLQQQFRAFAGAVACTVLNSDLQAHAEWGTAWPLRSLLEDDVMVGSGGGGGKGGKETRRNSGEYVSATGRATEVEQVLSASIPEQCWTFTLGSVAFVLAPRGSGGGFRTFKRLAAELKGGHIVRMLSGSIGRAGVNALPPLSCVVDVLGCRAAAVALPGFRVQAPRSRGESALDAEKRNGHIGAVRWNFSEVRRVGPGRGSAPTPHRDVRSLVSDHLRLDEGDEPDLSVVEGVLASGGRGKDKKRQDAAQSSASSHPARIVLFPDLLPPEVVSAESDSSAVSGGSPEAIWGCVDAVRAVFVPQDLSSRVHTVLSLDLSVAEASIAAEAALAADHGGLDRYPPIEPPGWDGGEDAGGGDSGRKSAFRGSSHGTGKTEDMDDEAGVAPFISFGGKSRRNLIVQAVSAVLGCDRGAVVGIPLASSGMEIFHALHDVDGVPYTSVRSGAPEELSSAFAAATLGASMAAATPQTATPGSTGGDSRVNERASAIIGKKVYGNAVVMLEDGGAEHGAAGNCSPWDATLPGTSSAEKARNPLRLREELLRQRRPKSGARVLAGATREGSRLITETLLPRLAARVADDATCSGCTLVGSVHVDERNPPLFVFEGGHLCAAMHAAGLNLRYLPALRQKLGWAYSGTRQLIAAELLARTAKHILACRQGDRSPRGGSSTGAAAAEAAAAAGERRAKLSKQDLDHVGLPEDDGDESLSSGSSSWDSSSDSTQEGTRRGVLALLNAILYRTRTRPANEGSGDQDLQDLREFSRWSVPEATPTSMASPRRGSNATGDAAAKNKEPEVQATVTKARNRGFSEVVLPEPGYYPERGMRLVQSARGLGLDVDGPTHAPAHGIDERKEASSLELSPESQKKADKAHAVSVGVLIGDSSPTPPPLSRLQANVRTRHKRIGREKFRPAIARSPHISERLPSLSPSPQGKHGSNSSRSATGTVLTMIGGFFDSRNSSSAKGQGGDASGLNGAPVATASSGAPSLSVSEESALFWEVESRLWLLLGPYGAVGGMTFTSKGSSHDGGGTSNCTRGEGVHEDDRFADVSGEACSRLHMCQGLSGLHLLPALMRSLGVVLTPAAIRRMQEEACVSSVKKADVDSRTSGPAALEGTRFKGMKEEATSVKRRLREKCRRKWTADGKMSSRSSNGSNGEGRGGETGGSNGAGGGTAGIGWTGVTAEERAQYAIEAENVLGHFVDPTGRDDVPFARREIAEARLTLAVTDWYEGRFDSARREVDRAVRTLLEGKLVSPAQTDSGGDTGLGGGGPSLSLRESVDLDEPNSGSREVDWAKELAKGDEEMPPGVPVPLALCIGAALMRLITHAGDDGKRDAGAGSTVSRNASNGVIRGWTRGIAVPCGSQLEDGLVLLWRILQIHFPGSSSSTRIQGPPTSSSSSSPLPSTSSKRQPPPPQPPPPPHSPSHTSASSAPQPTSSSSATTRPEEPKTPGPGRTSSFSRVITRGEDATTIWGHHPLVPAIACLLTGNTLGELTEERGVPDGGRPASGGRRRTNVAGGDADEAGGRSRSEDDWLGGLLETTRFPGQHLGVLVGRRSLSPVDAAIRMVYIVLKGQRGFVEKAFKSSLYVPGTAEVMTAPEAFAWLLPDYHPAGHRRTHSTSALGGLPARSKWASTTLPSLALPRSVHTMIDAVKRQALAVAGRVYVEGKVTGLSAEEALQQAARADGDAEDEEEGTAPLSMFRLPTECRVLEVSCGYRHSAIVAANGLVLTFGHGETGRLGHGDENDVLRPKVVRVLADAGEAVVSASCGREHTLVALFSGGACAWGWGEGGRLGLGEDGAVLSPRRIVEFDNLGVSITRVACGREHSLAVSRSGRLYTFGPSDGGRLGLEIAPDERGVSAPRVVGAPALEQEKVVAAAGGDMHSACVCVSGKVFTWGHGETGALGHGSTEEEMLPRRVQRFGRGSETDFATEVEEVKDEAVIDGSSTPRAQGDTEARDVLLGKSVACGAWHTLVSTDCGRVFAFGDGFTGQLGLHDRGDPEGSRALTPREVVMEQDDGGRTLNDADTGESFPSRAVRLTQVACGSFTSAAISSDGVLYRWGKADASLNADPVSDPLYLLPRRATSSQGNSSPLYRTVAQGGFLTVAIADGLQASSAMTHAAAPEDELKARPR